MSKRTLFSWIIFSNLLGCTTADKNLTNPIRTAPLAQSENALAYCNAEAGAYQPTQTIGERGILKENPLIIGGGFGGEIVRAQQIKKNQEAREKILRECLIRTEQAK
jgi:hypothetical protein